MAEPTSALNAADLRRRCAPSRSRDRVGPMSLEDKGQGGVLVIVRHNTVETECEEKPALVADTLAMIRV
jgi:hypothetical protein